MSNDEAPTSRLRQLTGVLNPAKLQSLALRQRAAGNGWKAFGLQQLAIFVHTARGLRHEEITRRAAALTYHSLLSIVPVLAVAFALFKAFGGLQKLEGPLRALIVDNLAAGRSAEVGAWIDRFISNINAGAIAGVGVIFLFYTAMGLLGNVEQAFNRIWGIERARPLHMRFAIYWCVLTLAPPLIGLSLSMSARLQSSTFAGALQSWLPFGLGRLIVAAGSAMAVCGVFVFLYQLVPNTKVRFRCALLGGVVAGLLWNASKVLFLWLTAGSVKYSAIYGALGALPLIMLWIYLSWIIVLFGVTFTFANQTLSTSRLEDASTRVSQSYRELLALRILAAAARRFRAGDDAENAERLAHGTGAPMGAVRSVIEQLLVAHLLQEVGGSGGDAHFAPGRSLAEITMHDVVRALRSSETNPELADDPGLLAISELLGRADEASAETLGDWTLDRLVSEIEARERDPDEAGAEAADVEAAGVEAADVEAADVEASDGAPPAKNRVPDPTSV